MSADKSIKIKILHADSAYEGKDISEENQVKKLITDRVIPAMKKKYLEAKVRIIRDSRGNPDFIISYLSRADEWTLDVVKAEVDKDYSLKSIIKDFDDEGDYDKESVYVEAGAYDVVLGTAYPDVGTTRDAVMYLKRIAEAQGYSVKTLIGTDATVVAYKNYIQSCPKAFFNVGHGNTNCISLDDGILSYTFFQGLGTKDLNDEVIYFNSCKVFNVPMKPSVMGAGARTFIGGIVNISISKSEKVFKCFWDKVWTDKEKMGESLTNCEILHYPPAGHLGIDGDTGKFE